MANIDVSFVLDSDFCDPVVVSRWNETVGDDGRAIRVLEEINAYASIQASSGDNLFLSPDLARSEGTYECITIFPLAVATDTTAADEVTWKGETFVVTQIGRFGNYGAGHYEGMLTLKSLTTKVGKP
jgi:hypothetical protein